MTAPSLNEVARQVTGAAQGLGWPTGISRDVGAAAAWLCGAAGVDGVQNAMDALTGARNRPELRRGDNGRWHLRGPTTLTLPSALDLALTGETTVIVEQPDSPMLAFGLCGWAAQQTGRIVVMEGAVTARIYGGKIDGPPHLVPGADLTLFAAGPAKTRPAPRISRAFPDPTAWAAAQHAAAQMRVPATAASRERGAGPVGIDAD